MKESIIAKLRKKIMLRKTMVRAVVFSILVVVLSTLIYLTYNQYKKTIVNQQQQNMLGISRSISRSIELYISDIVDSMKVITLDKEFTKSISLVENGKINRIYNERIRSYYEAEGEAINAVYFLDASGNLLTQYPQGAENSNLKEDIDKVIARKKTHIGRPYLDKNKNIFILNIYEPVFDEDNFKGVLSVAISLNTIYDRLIAPVKIGDKGYAMVKDQDGIIIMHPVKEQVGMDVIETRKQVYPNLDYQELENLINDQLTGKEGTAIYHSYWWGDNLLIKAKKLSAYTPVKLGDYFWVVALTMSYDEIQGPITKFSGQIIGIAILIAAIIYAFVSALIKMKKNKEELEKETKYLKMLNETSEQLRKKEAELYHSHKLKMIGTLAGGIAHDINNLLTPILGYSELLLMQISKENEHYEEVEEIYKASQKGKDLIEQILLFSRKDNGIVKIEPIDIYKVTMETVKLVKAILPKKVIIKENIKECGYINANFTQIHQVIFNLCTNAYQAIKGNKGIIEILLSTVVGEEAHKIDKRLLKENCYVELIVKDTGCGMDEETKARIFDPFFTTKDIGEGTGLGLFVVQSIIDKYEGIITVDSKLEVGSCFKVYLPLINEQASAKNDSCSENTKEDNKNILIVDDNDKVAKVLKKGLEHLGYQVTTETNSMKALKLFQSKYKKFDIVITDYMMPNLNGSELAANIKKIKKETRVILMTGYMDKDVISETEAIDAYISKPVELAKLSELIKNTKDI